MSYPPPQGGYPPQQQGGYPPQQGGYPPQQGGYPPQQGGYPPQQGGYPPQQQGGYPPQQGGYPPQQQGGYPPQQGGYPPQQGGYPGQYPPQQGGYPPAQGGYPPAQPHGAYPPAAGGYPPAQPHGAYPPQQHGAYPPAAGGYPPAGGYPGAQPQGAYPPAAGGYPPAAGGYPPAAGGYPGAQPHGAYPPAAGAYPPQAGYPAAAPVAVAPAVAPPGGFTYVTPASFVALYPGYQVRCDPVRDADDLRYAMKGVGTDESTLIRILGNRNPVELDAIKQVYQKKHHKSLLDTVKGETSGHFQQVMTSLLMDPLEQDTQWLHTAMKGAGTNENILMTILVSRNNEQKAAISNYFARLRSKTLPEALKDELSGDFERLCLALLNPREPDSPVVNPDVCRADAERLYKAGEGKIGTDEKTFIDIMTRKSWSHLRQVFAMYQTIHKCHTIEKAIDSEMSGYLRKCLIGIATFARSPGEFFADMAREAMKGIGTNDDALVCILVGNRFQMPDIKSAYARKHGKSLHSAVSSETSGDFKKSLMMLIGA
eukprot:TRINITY_DN456_c0_g1_i1.p1 TRINITY_DN456_c0_g1~~TRINITY_DN456_c0_g1_i1.p1  ORF type:complete len:540 (-),score=186.30 TRINITY_DN456_c0_g1_i1:39-1658(-)